MHKSTDNFTNVLFSGKFNAEKIRRMIDNDSSNAEKSSDKNYQSEDTSDKIVSKKANCNNEIYDLDSTSTATSQNLDYVSGTACIYNIQQYIYHQFQQVFL